MILELIKAFGLIFIAEMGDKTQILAMAFATKYKIKKVVLGIFIGSLLNHALAIVLGSNLQYFIPLETLSIIAGVSFILFGLWSFKMDDEEEIEQKQKYGPVVTVSLAFFIGELGDKTQLTAIALSTDASYPIFILMGTVLGMVVTGLLGIFLGIKIGHKIDEFFIKIGAGIIFIVFGYIKLSTSLPSELLTSINIIVVSTLIIVLSYTLILPSIKLRRLGKATAYQVTATKLHDYYTDMYERINDVCLGLNTCGNCGGDNCLVGYTKNILLCAKNNKEIYIDYIVNPDNSKNFDRSKVLEAMKLTVEFLKDDWNKTQYKKVQKVRQNLEMIMYKKTIQSTTFEEYLTKLKIIDIKLYNQYINET